MNFYTCRWEIYNVSLRFFLQILHLILQVWLIKLKLSQLSVDCSRRVQFSTSPLLFQACNNSTQTCLFVIVIYTLINQFVKDNKLFEKKIFQATSLGFESYSVFITHRLRFLSFDRKQMFVLTQTISVRFVSCGILQGSTLKWKYNFITIISHFSIQKWNVICHNE